MFFRRKTKVIHIGSIKIGGNNPIAIQSMAKVKTSDVDRVVAQIKELENAGCEIIRVAVKDHADSAALRQIKKNIKIPLAADIHFDWVLAVEAIESGVDKIRLNPGNIFKLNQIREVASAAKLAGIPIRVGLNSGSVGSGKDQVKAMVEKARAYIKNLEKFKFRDIVVSLKAQNARDTITAYREMSGYCDYPFHLGVTATGLPQEGLIKSNVAIGTLLLDGIGDTIRISLTDKPQEEVKAARLLLKSLGLRNFGPEIISCPTCGRCEVNLFKVVKDLENQLQSVIFKPKARPIQVAIMGCVVNGPGEAKHADLGIAFGKKDGLLFKKGRPIVKVSIDRCVEVLIKEIKRIA
ncbi:MAG: flavodoxin-dependent (E)-4-hydroxy-3-methylbut-2-enyl-diphosphate synthase [Candidatus Omnitrophica bacterium]|nr:flavodoxin-dependent (E)-4-hydroxy-3-methylbut-2-enyl-diphosphate synthase [Candidatus Omnitrophota bacterium]